MNTQSVPSPENPGETEIQSTPATDSATDAPSASPAKRGRPSGLTPEIEAALFECLELGLNVIEACGVCGVSEKSFRNWRGRSPAFAAKMKQAEYEAVKIHIANIRKAAMSGQSWRASAWWLEHRHPMQWGRTQTLTVEDKRRAEEDANHRKMTQAQRSAKIREIFGVEFCGETRAEARANARAAGRKPASPPVPGPDKEGHEMAEPKSDSPVQAPADEKQPPTAPVAVKKTPSVFMGGGLSGQYVEFDPMDDRTCHRGGYSLKKITFTWAGRERHLSALAAHGAEDITLTQEVVRLMCVGNQALAKALAAQESAEFSNGTPLFARAVDGKNALN